MRLDQKILKFLYQNRNDGNYHILIDNFNLDYGKIIGPIESLVSNGLVESPINHTLGMYEDPDSNSDYKKTNTKSKITQAGILYYEKTKETRINKTLSVLAIIVSLATLVFTVLDRLFFGN